MSVYKLDTWLTPPEMISILGPFDLDPFSGAGTTALVAARLNRRFLGVELNPEYVKMAMTRVADETSQGKFL